MAKLEFCVGHSDDPDVDDAVDEAVAQARSQLVGEPKAVLVFAGTSYDDEELLAHVKRHFGSTPMIGCTTDGELSSHAFSHDGVLITLLAGDAIDHVQVGMGRELEADAWAAVAQASSGMANGPALVLSTPSSFKSNLDETMRALQARFEDTPIAGGASGDRIEFHRAREFANGVAAADSIPLMAIYGDIEVSLGVASGWEPVGQAWVATKTVGNVVYELDGEPALQKLESWVGTSVTAVTLEFPLAVFPAGADGQFYLRAVFSVDTQTGAIHLPAEVPQGSQIRMTRASHDGVLSGADQAIQQVMSGLGGPPAGCFVFSCTGRKWVLGTRAEEEREHILAHTDGPIAGFYGFAELGPLGDLGASVHNQTCVAVGLRAR
ncbi:MAG: hypothetical protein ACI9VR_000915 [Cognaticolwellia sp.]|jgi:hypothetical protein